MLNRAARLVCQKIAHAVTKQQQKKIDPATVGHAWHSTPTMFGLKPGSKMAFLVDPKSGCDGGKLRMLRPGLKLAFFAGAATLFISVNGYTAYGAGGDEVEEHQFVPEAKLTQAQRLKQINADPRLQQELKRKHQEEQEERRRERERVELQQEQKPLMLDTCIVITLSQQNLPDSRSKWLLWNEDVLRVFRNRLLKMSMCLMPEVRGTAFGYRQAKGIGYVPVHPKARTAAQGILFRTDLTADQSEDKAGFRDNQQRDLLAYLHACAVGYDFLTISCGG